MREERIEQTLKVSGHGKVELMPDEVEIVFFLQQQDKSFVKAQAKVKARFGELEKMVADFGLRGRHCRRCVLRRARRWSRASSARR